MSEQAETLSPDQRMLLGHVTAVESSLGAAAPEVDEQGNPVPPSAAPAENPAEENKAILETLIGILTPALPFLPEIYTPEVIQRIAYAYTAVEEKYGWNVRGLMGVEAQLAIVAIPPTVQAIVLGRAYFEMKKREAEKVINPKEGGSDGGQ